MSGEHSTIRVGADTQVQGLVWLVLNRPEARNAWTEAMIEAFCAAVSMLDRQEEVRVLAITGAGTSFSAGGDLKAMQARSGMFAGDPMGLRERYARGIQEIPRVMASISKPVIAVINGAAIGAGLDLCCMCDLRIMASDALLGSTFVKIGLIPGDGGAFLLTRILGAARASELVLTGKLVDAAWAERAGLVNAVLSQGELANHARSLALQLMEAAPVSQRLAKRLLQAAPEQHLQSALEMAATYQGISQRTNDHIEGVNAFLERRKPNFQGS